MERLSYIYKTEEDFKNHLEDCNFDYEKESLVKIFTLSIDEENSVEIAKQVKNIIPNSTIIGASSISALIYKNEQLDEGAMIVVEQYDDLNVLTGFFKWDEVTAADLANDVYSHFWEKARFDKRYPTQILISDGYCEVNTFLKALNEKKHVLKLAGGIVGSNLRQTMDGFLFNETGILKNTMVVFTAIGQEEYGFVKMSISQDPISETYEITQVDDNGFITEIENTPSVKWFANYLSSFDKTIVVDRWSEFANYNHLPFFPFIMQDGSQSGHFLRYEESVNSFATYFSKQSVGDKFKVGYVNPSKTIKESCDVCKETLNTPIEHMFIYSCCVRRTHLKNCTDWEISPFRNYGVDGIYTVGEISYYNGINSLYNGTCVFVGFGEHENYLIPDTSALNDSAAVYNDSSFFSHDIENSNASYSITNGKNIESDIPDFFNKIHRQLNIDHYMDENLDIPNIYKFNEDNSSLTFNKLSLLEIQSADATIAYAGLTSHYELFKYVIKKMKMYLKKYTLHNFVRIYALNYKTIILAATDDVLEDAYVDCLKSFYLNYELVTSKSVGVSAIIRLGTVVNQKDLLEIAISLLISTKNSQENFLVCHEDVRENKVAVDELKTIDLIKRAIKNDWVVPYFQGIHNNKINKIDKYESLMRIVDDDGKMYSPFIFMDIAKNYKLYNKLSQMLIEKAMNYFSGREETVSINVSLLDIMSSSFRLWFVDKLKTYKNPENIVIEFVETESFTDFTILFEFIDNVKKYNCKIAIDDFGSGYSTLSLVVKIKPDFLKIDGSIVKHIAVDESMLVLLDTIKFFTVKMNTKIIAEFVEDIDIQNVLIDRGIDYSQGYYFAKPLPYEEI